ncbi:hypothetical protein AMTRI_Chr13g90030 [Amborella trichopoda]
MTTQRVTIIELSQEKPIKIIDPTTFNDLPEGASKMNFSLWDHSFLWGHISVSMPSLEAKAEDLFKALFIVRSPYTPPIVVTESSDSSSFEDLSSCIRNWMPSKGVGGDLRTRLLKWLIYSHRPHILLLQETKLTTLDATLHCSFWCYGPLDFLFFASVGLTGGLLVLWDHSVVKGSRFFSNPWILTDVYGLKKVLFFLEFSSLISQSSFPWCGADDYNQVRYPSECSGGTQLLPEMNNFNNFFISHGLIDMNVNNTVYTWTTNLAISPQMSIIDGVQINNTWDCLFPKAFVRALPHMTLDHVPLLMDLTSDSFGPSPFRFELMWLEDSSLRSEMLSVWKNSIVQGLE